MTSNSLQAPGILPARVVPIRTLVVFDSRVSDIEILSSALLPGSIGFTIDAAADGLTAITQLLATTGAKYLAIVAHGEPGVVHLGRNPLNIQQLQAQSHLLQEWGVKEIALYSCEVAQGDVGKDLIYQLSELTGATVAGAATKTGYAALGGRWDLAVTTGEIAARRLFEASILTRYPTVLAVSFGAATDFSVGYKPSDITVGDFNGDGNLDLATTNEGSDNVSVLLGNATGGFGTATNFSLGIPVGTNPSAVTVGDFNGDGKLDLAAANYLNDSVSILLGNGTGGFGTATKFAAGDRPYDVTVGDFNGDGKLDLAATNISSSSVSVLLGNGNGSFGAATNFAVGTNAYAVGSVTVGDFNGDGKLDLAAANRAGNNVVSVLLGDGSGGFGDATNFAVGTSPSDVAVGDLNGDGKLDLAVTNSSSNNVSVLLGDGSGSFGAATNFAVGTSPIEVRIGDFNGDGKLDLATANYNSNNVSVLLGTGTGSFGAATNVAGLSPSDLAVGDFNGDGKLDLTTVNRSGNVSVLLNTTTATPTRNDFNRDGKSDILWRNDNGDVALWQMNGSNLTTGSVFANVSTAWTIANTGDFNGDSKADILWRNTTDGQVAIWQMNGNTPTTQSVIGSVPTNWQISSTGDFNGDSKSDILWRNTTDGSVAIWQMNGNTPTAQTVIGSAATDWKISGAGDFNGDGKSDILWRKTDGSVETWLMNGATVNAANLVSPNSVVDNSWKIAAPIL
jgi:Domain of unknown function (DUF4347)/FG-GAP-like repeat